MINVVTARRFIAAAVHLIVHLAKQCHAEIVFSLFLICSFFFLLAQAPQSIRSAIVKAHRLADLAPAHAKKNRTKKKENIWLT